MTIQARHEREAEREKSRAEFLKLWQAERQKMLDAGATNHAIWKAEMLARREFLKGKNEN